MLNSGYFSKLFPCAVNIYNEKRAGLSPSPFFEVKSKTLAHISWCVDPTKHEHSSGLLLDHADPELPASNGRYSG